METVSTPSAGSAQRATVRLDTPIQRGETQIATVTVRAPTAGELRGVQLSRLLASDVDTLMMVLPRVTEPPITKPELGALGVGDLIALGGELVNFSLPASAREAALQG
jgi:hypothetical protein